MLFSVNFRKFAEGIIYRKHGNDSFGTCFVTLGAETFASRNVFRFREFWPNWWKVMDWKILRKSILKCLCPRNFSIVLIFSPFFQRFHPKTWACFRNFFFFESITLKITLIFFYFLFWVLCFLLKKKRKEEKKKKREKIQFMLAKSLTENTIEPVPEENVFYNQVSATKRVLSNFVRGKFQKFHVF